MTTKNTGTTLTEIDPFAFTRVTVKRTKTDRKSIINIVLKTVISMFTYSFVVKNCY